MKRGIFLALAILAVPVPIAASAVQQPNRVTAAALIGRWGDNGDCTKDVVFLRDGTFRSYTGGGGRWTLRGDRLTLNGNGGVFAMRVSWAGRNRLSIINPDGSQGFSQRC